MPNRDGGAINPQAAGTLRLWSAGDDEPSTSQLNFAGGYDHSDLEILQPGDDGEISVHNLSSGTVDVVVDLQGWFSYPNEVDADATVTDFDPSVAAQNGFTIKTAADGTDIRCRPIRHRMRSTRMDQSSRPIPRAGNAAPRQ